MQFGPDMKGSPEMNSPPPPPWARWYDQARRLPDRPDLRVSDAERGSIGEALGRHYADGRLDQAEFNERLDRAMKAKTRADLSGLLTDLPRLDVEAAPVRPPRRRWPVVGLVLLAAFVVSATSWAFFTPHVPWLLIAIVVLLVARRRSWRRFHHEHHHSHVLAPPFG
jgi:hypothetical protein